MGHMLGKRKIKADFALFLFTTIARFTAFRCIYRWWHVVFFCFENFRGFSRVCDWLRKLFGNRIASHLTLVHKDHKKSIDKAGDTKKSNTDLSAGLNLNEYPAHAWLEMVFKEKKNWLRCIHLFAGNPFSRLSSSMLHFPSVRSFYSWHDFSIRKVWKSQKKRWLQVGKCRQQVDFFPHPFKS